MHLILWRHAEAEDGAPDLDRRLTDKGSKQADAMALWLKPRLPKHWRLLSSPATRCRQTALALSEEFEIVREIAPGAGYTSVLAAAGWPDAGDTVVLVGHQPTLGETAAMLLSGQELPWSVRKGSIWWLTHRVRHTESQIVLRAVVSPEML